jgi:hypothetical protein
MNWGKGITIVMIAFMGFIGSMVYWAFTKNADLIREDYYESELAYDATKKEKENYYALTDSIQIEKLENGVVFTFPKEVHNVKGGKIQFYRPDQKKYDREFELKIDEQHKQALAYDNFREGYYDIYITWKDADKNFRFESNLSF